MNRKVKKLPWSYLKKVLFVFGMVSSDSLFKELTEAGFEWTDITCRYPKGRLKATFFKYDDASGDFEEAVERVIKAEGLDLKEVLLDAVIKI